MDDRNSLASFLLEAKRRSSPHLLTAAERETLARTWVLVGGPPGRFAAFPPVAADADAWADRWSGTWGWSDQGERVRLGPGEGSPFLVIDQVAAAVARPPASSPAESDEAPEAIDDGALQHPGGDIAAGRPEPATVTRGTWTFFRAITRG
jgi:hypothetical protein